MPRAAKPTEEEKSADWAEEHYKLWGQARGAPEPRYDEEVKEHMTADWWDVQSAIAREGARQTVQ